MINLKLLINEFLISEDLNRISLQNAIDKKMFGPVYHGTDQEKLSKIEKEGFKIFQGLYGSANISQGYINTDYYAGIPAPIHHLGFGIYFTTSKTIAKKFAGGTTKGMKPYFLDVPRLETINFAAPRTMMKWWIDNGYDPELAKQGEGGRYHATVKLTEHLKSKFDAVWFKGRTIRSVLDGDQICVYDVSSIYLMDKSLILPGEVGSKVKAKNDFDPYKSGNVVVPKGTVGIITKKYKPAEMQDWARGSEYIYHVKFKTGGNQYNLLDSDIEPV